MCRAHKATGYSAHGVITLPNGACYLHREWAAAWALFTLGIIAGLGLLWTVLTH